MFNRCNIPLFGREMSVIEVRVKDYFGDRVDKLAHKTFLIYTLLDKSGNVLNGTTIYDLMGREQDLKIFRKEALIALGIMVSDSYNIVFSSVCEDEEEMIVSEIDEAMQEEINVLGKIIHESTLLFHEKIIQLGALFTNSVWEEKKKSLTFVEGNIDLLV